MLRVHSWIESCLIRQPEYIIAPLISATGLADFFNPNAGAYVTSIAVQTDGRILAAVANAIEYERRGRFELSRFPVPSLDNSGVSGRDSPLNRWLKT